MHAVQRVISHTLVMVLLIVESNVITDTLMLTNLMLVVQMVVSHVVVMVLLIVVRHVIGD